MGSSVSAIALSLTLTGTVSWGKVEPPTPVPIARDRHVCGKGGPIYSKDIRVDEAGRIEGAVVWVEVKAEQEAPLPPRPTPSTVIIDQRNCSFSPHVAAAAVGSSIRFSNSDPLLHNVHILDESDRTLVSYAMPLMGQAVHALTALRSGVLRVRCDAGHTWMRAFIRVFDQPHFALTGAHGTFSIGGLPSGRHRVVAWHPDLGRVEREIALPGELGGNARVELVF